MRCVQGGGPDATDLKGLDGIKVIPGSAQLMLDAV